MSARALPIDWTLAAAEVTQGETATVPETGPPDEEDVKIVAPDGCCVYSAGSLYEAQLVLDLLAEAGIAASLFNQHLIGALGELPFGESLPKIWLPDESDWSAARSVIEAYEARRKQVTDGTRLCALCGEDGPDNFELCWSCRAPYDTE